MARNLAPHYSSYVRQDNLIFTSGQLPLLDRTSKEVPSGIKEQTLLVLQKVEKLLISEGLDRQNIIKTTAFITDIDYWNEVNEVYFEFFGDYKPARSIIPVSKLHYGCKIELEAIAIVK